MRLNFRNGSDVSIGTATLSDSDPGPANVWNLNTGVGFVPVGTASIRALLYRPRTAGGPGADGYMDNIDVRIKAASSELMFLEVNTTNGQVRVRTRPARRSTSTTMKSPAPRQRPECDCLEQPPGAESGRLSRRQRLGQRLGASRRKQFGRGERIVPDRQQRRRRTTRRLVSVRLQRGRRTDFVPIRRVVDDAPNPTGDYNDNGTVDAADYHCGATKSVKT